MYTGGLNYVKKKKKPFEEGEANQHFLFSLSRSGSNLGAHLAHNFWVLWAVRDDQGPTTLFSLPLFLIFKLSYQQIIEKDIYVL